MNTRLRQQMIREIELRRERRYDYLALCLVLWAVLLGIGIAGVVAPLPLLVIATASLAMSYLVYRYRSRIVEPLIQMRDSTTDENPLALWQVLNPIPEAVVLIDPDGRIVFANQAAAAMFGDRLEDRLYHIAIRTPELVAALESVMETSNIETFDFSRGGAVEEHFQAFVSAMQGKHAILVVRDLTALKRTDQMRADFIANASHELRTPLASISGFIETLQGPAKDDEEAQARFLGIMAEQASRMRRLIDDLMSLSRIEMSEHVNPEGSVNLPNLVSAVADGLAPLAEQVGVVLELQVRPEDQSAEVIGDEGQLFQVITNLIENAIRYGKSGKNVEINLSRSGNISEGWCLKVQDFGPGIPQKYIHRLTERFFRVNEKESQKVGGTGLGLAIVKHILKRHRGHLEVFSEEGAGTSFLVHLPGAKV